MMLAGGFGTFNFLAAGDFRSSSIRGTLLPSLSDSDIQTAALIDNDSSKRASAISHGEKAWHVGTTGIGERRTGEHERGGTLRPFSFRNRALSRSCCSRSPAWDSRHADAKIGPRRRLSN